MRYFIIRVAGKIFGGRKYLKGEHTSSVWLCVTLLLGWRGKFLEGENICAQGFFSFAQGEKKFVKNEGEIVRVRNTLHLGSEPLLNLSSFLVITRVKINVGPLRTLKWPTFVQN